MTEIQLIECENCGNDFNSNRHDDEPFNGLRCAMCGHEHDENVEVTTKEVDGKKLYVIQSESGQVKIGIAKNVRQRMKSIRCGSPEEIEVVAVFNPDNAKAAEEKVHSRIADKHEHGEWFDYSDGEVWDLVDAIDLLLGGCRLIGPKNEKQPSAKKGEAIQ